MLPLWNYVVIALVGIFTTNRKEDRAICYLYLYYISVLALSSFLLFRDTYLYFSVRFLVIILPTYIFVFSGTANIKFLFVICAMYLVECVFIAGYFLNSLELFNLALLISPYQYEILTVVVGLFEWVTVRHALLGCSLSTFYIIHLL